MPREQTVLLSTNFRLDVKAMLWSSSPETMKVSISDMCNAKGVSSQSQQAGLEIDISV